MHRPLLLILVISFLGILTIPLEGQKVLDLKECISIATKQNLDLQRSALGMETAQINLDQAKQARYPNLNANTNLGWNFGRTIDPTSNSFVNETFFSNNYGLSSGMILFDGFRIKNTISKNELDLEASSAEAQQLSLDIALQVALNYLNVLFTKENITIAEKQLELNNNQLTLVKRSISAGAMAASESLSIEAQISQNEQALVVASNNYELALFRLKQSIRLSPDEDLEIVIPEEISYEIDPDLLTYEELVSTAMKNRWDLKAVQLRTKSSELDVDVAKSGYYPTLTLSGNVRTNYSNQAIEVTGSQQELVTQDFTLQDGTEFSLSQLIDRPTIGRPGFSSQLDNFLSYGFGLNLNIPIYNNGATKANVQRAELSIENQRLNQEQLLDNFSLSMQQALTDARAAKRKLAASEKTYTIQQKAYENVTKRYELGASNSFEWENQKSQLESAEVTRLIDKYDYLFKVKVLEFHLGKPLNF